MIIYEVSVRVDSEIADEFEQWLPRHISEILAIDGFINADRYDATDVDGEQREHVIHYRLRDRASLRTYFQLHAERMRADGLQRFGGRFTATRRILEPRNQD